VASRSIAIRRDRVRRVTAVLFGTVTPTLERFS
jgi:hypothetical protein